MTTTLATVPKPGRCRSGIHSNNTSAAVKAVTVPKVRGVRSATPSCSTSHGFRPSPERVIIAMLVP